MKLKQNGCTTNHSIRHWSLQQVFFFLKAFFVGSWFALGNALLLIGGDDSVEIGSPLTLNLTTIPLSGNNIEGGRA